MSNLPDEYPSTTAVIPSVWASPNLGWQCPACGYVWAPHVTGCGNCNRLKYGKATVTTPEMGPYEIVQSGEVNGV